MIKIDAHHHLWQHNPEVHDWITDDMAILRRNYMPSDLQKVMNPLGFTGCVAVQASQTEEETNFLIEQANRYPFIKGVVGWLDLRAGNLKEKLDYFTTYPTLKGLRHVVQDEPDDQFMLQPEFLKGIETLADYNLTYDILIFPSQLDAAIELVRRFPQHRFVLDHIAKPLIKDKILAPWKDKIHDLADAPNIFCKISGMVTEADWHQWKTDDFHPYLDVVFNAFGEDRLMIGSDWPVCLLAAGYSEVIDIVDSYITSEKAREKIMGKNAIAFYGL